MAEIQYVEILLQKGVELFRAKRFKEAEPIFRQVLTLEPRHTGAAYLLSLCLYFSGQFHPALGLFGQLTAPNIPLDPRQTEKLIELSRYALFETIRLDSGDFTKAFQAENSILEARILDRSGRVILMQDFRDLDDIIGPHLEVVHDRNYSLIPFRDLAAVEFGPLKRWITAQVVWKAGRRETVATPLTYRDSMAQSAFGVPEGIETIVKPWEVNTSINRAYGQKQFRSVTTKIPLSEVLRIEF